MTTMYDYEYYTIDVPLAHYLIGKSEKPLGRRTLHLNESTLTVELVEAASASVMPEQLAKIRKVITQALMIPLYHIKDEASLDVLHDRLKVIDTDLIEEYNKINNASVARILDPSQPDNFEDWIAIRREVLRR